MSVNILEELRKNVGMQPLIKVDPNTQEVKITSDKEKENKLMQAIVPSVVAGLYDCARSEEGLNFLAGTASTPDWLTLLFGKNAPEVKLRLANYSNNTEDAVQTHFNSVAAEGTKILRANAGDSDRKVSIRNIAGAQRDWFLPYLPAELQIGKLLEDNTMDDRTNKMEGPVSSFMHKIETLLTGQESKEEANKKRNEKM